MQAVRATYENGRIKLLSPIEGVEQAELYIVVLDQSKESDELRQKTTLSEQEFSTLGLKVFCNSKDDDNIDWEEVFDVKRR